MFTKVSFSTQVYTTTHAPSANGTYSFTCGFKPSFVYYGQDYNSSSTGQQMVKRNDLAGTYYCNSFRSDGLVNTITITDSGFTVSLSNGNWFTKPVTIIAIP